MSNKLMKFSQRDFGGHGSFGQELYIVSDPDYADFGAIVISQDNDDVMPFVHVDGSVSTHLGSRMVRRLGVQLDFKPEAPKFQVGDAVLLAGRDVEGENVNIARCAIVTAIDENDELMGVRCSYVDDKGGYDWRPQSAILKVTQVAHNLKPL